MKRSTISDRSRVHPLARHAKRSAREFVAIAVQSCTIKHRLRLYPLAQVFSRRERRSLADSREKDSFHECSSIADSSSGDWWICLWWSDAEDQVAGGTGVEMPWILRPPLDRVIIEQVNPCCGAGTRVISRPHGQREKEGKGARGGSGRPEPRAAAQPGR